jgi:hypothetical protein
MMKLLFNPFERIAGWKALAIGISFMSLTAIFGKINNIIFCGVLYANIYFPHTFVQAFYTLLINWGVLSLVMWMAGKLFSKTKIRIIDIAGTMALSLAPLLLIVLSGFLPFFPKDILDI